jgi:oxygen-dependent protoporphyrinogen oxidase
MSSPDVLIVGAGISGLSTAWWLAQQGISVEIWEADERPGGKINTVHEAGYITERAAGLLVNFRPEIDHLINLLGLNDTIRKRDESLKRYIVHKGNLTQVPMLFPALLASPLWSLSAKLRLIGEIFIPKGQHEGESVSDFIRRRLGSEVLDTAIDAFICGTLASDPDLAEAQSVLPRLTALENRYGSLTTGMLVNKVLKRRRANTADTFSFHGGMSELTDKLARSPGVTVRCNAQVDAITNYGDQWQITGIINGVRNRISVPQLVLSTPADVAGHLLSPMDKQLGMLLSGIAYSPIAVVHLGLKSENIRHTLDGTGFLVSKQNHLPVNGNLWMSRLFPHRAPEEHTLLTSYLGGARRPEQLDQTDEQLTDTVLDCLRPLLGVKGSADYVRVERHYQGLPLYHGEYRAKLAEVDELLKTLPGLHLNGNYMEGVSVRERIFQGQRLARNITGRLLTAGRVDLEQPPLALAR